MNEDRNNERYYEDEIDLRELIMALWKRKKMIISLTLVAGLIAGMFSLFVLSPVYEANLNIVISMPKQYTTRYGEYSLPITTNEQYLSFIKSNDVLNNTIKDMEYSNGSVSLESLNNRISITKPDAKAGTVQNSFEVKVSSNNSQESIKLAQSLYKNYLEFMDFMTKERAVNYYYNYYYISIKSLENNLNSEKEILINNEELLAQTQQFIAGYNSNIQIQTKLDNTNYYAVPVDTLNPNYIKLENDIILNKQSINKLENTIRMYNIYLDELDAEKESINKYYTTGEAEKFKSSIVGIVESNIYLPSAPVAPTHKSSPNNSLNAAIGLVLGGMLGVFIALFLEYWFKEDKIKINK